MAVPVFLLRAGVAFAVVTVFHRPVPPRRLGRTLLFVHSEAADKVAEAGNNNRRCTGVACTDELNGTVSEASWSCR
jgi:hypothetical protein